MNANSERQIAAACRTLTLIACAMAAGILTFAIITIFLRAEKTPSEGILHFLAVGFAAAATFAAFLAPSILSKNTAARVSEVNANEQTETEDSAHLTRLIGMYQTKTIITLAIIEAAAFFNLVAYFIEGQKIALYTGAAFIGLILAQIPTKQRIWNWLNERRTHA